MRNLLRNNKGFTLIEMMIVLLIISVLILISIPNVTKHSANIDNKGCAAYVKMVEGQVQAYKIENNNVPTLADLSGEEYLGPDNSSCPNGDKIDIENGKVIIKEVANGGN
ncbi:MAG: competence type IV pilus major pilin ComGC [Psychrobacillus sp.]